MIGDRESYDDEQGSTLAEECEEYGPLDAMVRLDPAADAVADLGISLPPAWVERYGCYVVIRHTFDDLGDATRETLHPSEAHAVRAYAGAVAVLQKRGYVLVPE